MNEYEQWFHRLSKHTQQEIMTHYEWFRRDLFETVGELNHLKQCVKEGDPVWLSGGFHAKQYKKEKKLIYYTDMLINDLIRECADESLDPSSQGR